MAVPASTARTAMVRRATLQFQEQAKIQEVLTFNVTDPTKDCYKIVCKVVSSVFGHKVR